MTYFDQMMEATKQDFSDHIESNPLMQALYNRALTREQYIGYLTQNFHFVRNTAPALAMAASYIGEDRRKMRAWFIHHAEEEIDHDLLCLKDLEALGVDPEAARNSQIGPGAWGLVSQFYYIAAHNNPAIMMGMSSAAEGLGAAHGSAAADLIDSFGWAPKATRFLRSHGAIDSKHIDEVRDSINEFVRDDNEFRMIVFVRRQTIRYYGQMFLDAFHAGQNNSDRIAAE